MPKKTKKAKLKAQQRRFVPQSVASIQATSPTSDLPMSSSSDFRFTPSPKTEKKASSVAVTNITQLRRDLIKTLIITTAILVAEILLARHPSL